MKIDFCISSEKSQQSFKREKKSLAQCGKMSQAIEDQQNGVEQPVVDLDPPDYFQHIEFNTVEVPEEEGDNVTQDEMEQVLTLVLFC